MTADCARLNGFRIRVAGVTACGDGNTGFLAELVNNFVLIAGAFELDVAIVRFCVELTSVLGVGVLYCCTGEFLTRAAAV